MQPEKQKCQDPYLRNVESGTLLCKQRPEKQDLEGYEVGKTYPYVLMETGNGQHCDQYFRIWPDQDKRPGHYQICTPQTLVHYFEIL